MSIKKPSASRATLQTLAAFSPLTVANCELWLDASDSSSVTLTSSAVSQWNDLSGNNRHATQGTGNNRPTYTDKVNGRNVITFDGTNDSLISGLASSVITGYATLFCVCRPSSSWTASTANFKAPLMARNADQTLAWGICPYNDTSIGTGRLSLTHMWRGAGYNNAAGPAVTIGAVQLLAAVISATGTDRRSCGSSSTYPATLTAGTGGASNRYLTVGEDPTTLRYWTDYVAEVLAYSRALTTAEVLSIESYLIAKWGITRQ
jgi:spore coat protein U-like protein